MAGEGFAMHAAQSMKANSKLRNKRRSFKDISDDYKTKEMSNHVVFDRKVKEEYLHKEAITFSIVAFIISILSFVAMNYMNLI